MMVMVAFQFRTTSEPSAFTSATLVLFLQRQIVEVEGIREQEEGLASKEGVGGGGACVWEL